MAKPRSAAFETPTARLRLAVRKKSYSVCKLARGVHLTYRRNRANGTWSVKASDGAGGYWLRRVADAADFEPTNGSTILDYFQACEKALALARGGDDSEAPITLDVALTRYEQHLRSVGGDPYNAQRPRKHLSARLLARPVALLGQSGADELAAWRDSLLAKGLSPATVNRIKICVCAALALAAARNPAKITSTHGWRVGLNTIPDAHLARRVILSDHDVMKLVAASFDVNPRFGLLIAVLACTGARLSQAARLRVQDLEARNDRLQMPSSRKGRRRRITYGAVPIPRSLARQLARECEGRGNDEPLLLALDGSPWRFGKDANHQDMLREAAERAGLDPALTSYWLRHASIVRMLVAGTPAAIVAKVHFTSVKVIESSYGKYVADHAEALVRRGLLDVPLLAAPDVADSAAALDAPVLADQDDEAR